MQCFFVLMTMNCFIYNTLMFCYVLYITGHLVRLNIGLMFDYFSSFILFPSEDLYMLTIR